jgi:hypothetical protein
MEKRIIYLSLVVAVAQFSGCGGSSSADTTAPKFNSGSYQYPVDEGEIFEISNLNALTDDAEATFSGNGVIGDVLTFNAPQVDADTNYTIVVTATDKAGNTESQEFTFNVKDVPPEVNLGYVAITGDKDFTDKGNNVLEGPSGLEWKDEVNFVTYSDAVAACVNGYRLPTVPEVLNIIDYSSNQPSMLDSDFSNIATAVWTKVNGATQYYVNLGSGQDVKETNSTAEHFVICVKGDIDTTSPTFTSSDDNVTDSRTGYIWKKITVGDTKTYNEATSACTGEFNLPNINDLRSIYNYSTYTLPSEIAPAGVTSIWSNTEYPKAANKHYIILDDADNNSSVDNGLDTGVTRNVTCVKKPAQ